MDVLWLLAKSTTKGYLDGFRAPLSILALSAFLTLVLTPVAKRFAIRFGAVDDPTRDDRRVHTSPIPRWGGLAISGGTILSLLITLPFTNPKNPFPHYLIGMILVSIGLVIFGAFDDKKPVAARWQMLVLLAAGVLVQIPTDAWGGVAIHGLKIPGLGGQNHWVELGVFGIVITAIYVFVVTKTMDTIDGIDGLTAGIASIAASTLAIIATYQSQPRVALLAAAAAGSSIGFLRYNYNPAKIFMGTGGAQFLGFWLASLSIVGAMKTAATMAVFIPLLVFGVPILDAIVVIFRRILSRQPITQADKRHMHHALLAKGLSQRQAVWVLYIVAIALCSILITFVRMHG